MNNEEILKKAIEKAEANGFQWDTQYFRQNGFQWDTQYFRQKGFALGYWGDIIFSHDFAKAFCKDFEQGIVAVGPTPETTHERIGEGWQWLLQQLVLCDEPLQYLSNFL